MSEFFIGIIIVPLIGNVAEHLVAIQVAAKNCMDLSVNIALGSSLQIALFVAPVLVFISLLFEEAAVVFTSYELVALAAASVVAALVSQDGEFNWVEGVQLLAVYIIFGLAFYLVTRRRRSRSLAIIEPTLPTINVGSISARMVRGR